MGFIQLVWMYKDKLEKPKRFVAIKTFRYHSRANAKFDCRVSYSLLHICKIFLVCFCCCTCCLKRLLGEWMVAMGQLESLTATRAALWLRILFDGFGMPSAFYSANEAKRPQHTQHDPQRGEVATLFGPAACPKPKFNAFCWSLACGAWLGREKGLGRHVACKLLYSRTHTHP